MKNFGGIFEPAKNWPLIGHCVFRSTLGVFMAVVTFQFWAEDIGKSLHDHLYSENTEAKKEFHETLHYYDLRCQQNDASELYIFENLQRIDMGNLPSLDRWHHSQLKKMDKEAVCFYLTSLKPNLDPKARIQ